MAKAAKKVATAAKKAPKTAPKAAPAKVPAAKVPKAASKAETAAPAAAAAPAAPGAGLVITSNKVCGAFKTRAEKLVAGVKAAKPGVSIYVDAQPALGRNPDKGSFVVVAGGQTLVELRTMPRPFTAMKALDMDELLQRVLAAL